MTTPESHEKSVRTAPHRIDAQPVTPLPKDVEASMIDGLRDDIRKFNGRTACESGHDIRCIIGTALKFSTGFRKDVMPHNGEAASPEEVSRALSEIGRSTFLPRHEVLDVRLLGDRFEVVFGRIDPNSYQTRTYLGREIKTAHVRFSHGIENSMGLSIDNLAMIDPRLIRRDCDNFLNQLPLFALCNPYGAELSNFMRAKRFSAQRYYEVAGLQRLLNEELQHARDAVYINARTGNDGSRSERRQDVLLRPDSPLREILRLDRPGSDLGSVAISEYSSLLGGLVMELDHHLGNNDYDAARLAVVDFLTHQSTRSTVQPGDSIAVIYHIPALALFEGLQHAMPNVGTVPQLMSKLFAGSTPRQQVENCRKTLADLYHKDLWSNEERAQHVS